MEVRFFHGFCVLIEMKWQEVLCENIVRIVYLSMVRFRLLRLFMFIQKMDVWLSVSVYEKLSLQLYCAQVTCQKISREVGQKLSGIF